MKRLLLTITALVLYLNVFGQDGSSFSYHAVIHDKTGNILIAHPATLRISILQGNAFDSTVYSEIHKVNTDQYGMASVTVGKGTALTGDFSEVEWNNDKYFLRVEADVNSGTDFIDMGTTEILNVRSASDRKSGSKIIEDRLFISRKFVGTFLDYRHTGPDTYNGPNLIWIKTSMENIYGKISAYGKKCKFSPGDKLYIRRSNFSPGGISGYWIYQIENDSAVYYKATEFQHDRKEEIETWFN
jgi:hypothetical protein